MKTIHTLWFRCRVLFRSRRLEAEMAEEMRQHLERRTQEKIADGMTPDEARYAAQREFGGVVQVQEQCRDERRFVFFEQVWQDVHYAARALRKNPAFTTVAALTLALGIGANTAMFSVCNAVLFRPLPLPQPERIVYLDPGALADFSGGDYRDLRASRSFAHFAAYTNATFNLSGAGEPERLDAARVSADFLPTLGIEPWRGRNIRPEEDRDGGEKVALLSHALWRRKFAADDSAIGRIVNLNGQSHTVIGVLPPGVDVPPGREIFVPLALRPSLMDDYGGYSLKLIARLQPDVTRAAAEAEVVARVRRDGEVPKFRQEWTMRLISLHEARVSDLRTMLFVLMGAVGLVVLIACSNLASLLLAAATRRHREIALRLSLGASRARIIRQFLTESLLLAVLGGAAGILLAAVSLNLIQAGLPANMPRVGEINLDGRALAFTAAVVLLAGVGFGMLPALRASQTVLNDALKSGSRGMTGGAGGRVRGLLVVSQVTLTVILLTGAGLLLKSFSRLQDTPIGFKPEHLLTARFGLSGPRYAAKEQRVIFVQQFLEGLRRQPGLSEVAVVSRLPFATGAETYQVSKEGEEKGLNSVGFRAISPAYFDVLGVTLLAGRELTDADREGAPRVVVINDVLARKLWPNESPLGRRIRETSNDSGWREIVGVVSSVRHRSKATPPAPEIFVPWSQTPGTQINIAVRTPGAPEILGGTLRRAVASLDPELAVFDVRSMESRLEESVAQARFRTTLLSVFASIALVMAMVGLYGVMAYAVSQRTQEIGVRMALGARPRDVVEMVLGQGMKLTVLGIGLGLVGALALTRVLEKMLYDVAATDPLTFATVSLALSLVAALACWLPARRAAKVDPMVALRAE